MRLIVDDHHEPTDLVRGKQITALGVAQLLEDGFSCGHGSGAGRKRFGRVTQPTRSARAPAPHSPGSGCLPVGGFLIHARSRLRTPGEMHIPDGYLSPATCGTFGVAMAPVWGGASRRVRKVVKHRYVPLVALGAAYCFLVMMFNVPIPDGTTAHAVGGVLVAVLLGPWAAVIAVSVALAIQALFFGDGGVLAYGANAFDMAFVAPMVGYAVYWTLAHRAPLTSSRRPFAAGLGGYIGLNASALCAAIQLGVQPTLFHSANGTPLYSPFHLSQTIPAMAIAHLTVAGAVEFALTAGVVAYLQRANLPLLRINRGAAPA